MHVLKKQRKKKQKEKKEQWSTKNDGCVLGFFQFCGLGPIFCDSHGEERERERERCTDGLTESELTFMYL